MPIKKRKSPLKGRKFKNWGDVSQHRRLAKWTGSRTSKVSGHERRTNPDHKTVDMVAARELYLVSTNESRLNRMYEAICINLAKKMAKGTYSIPLAVKGWGHFIKQADALYKKDFGDSFNKATRDAAAAMVEADERHGINERAKDYAPKKKNPAPSAYARGERLRKITFSLKGKGQKHEKALGLLRAHREKHWRTDNKPGTKYETVYVVQGQYQGKWEDVSASLNPHTAKARLRDYEMNEAHFNHRLISRREKK